MKDPKLAMLEMYEAVEPDLTEAQMSSLGIYVSGWWGALMTNNDLPETYEKAQEVMNQIYTRWTTSIKKE
ncbi:hypothetical protein BI49514_02330 [Brevibacterium iodinum ATCC 49514]|uniref:Uncharacterized protein n=1 Tax=Brevibacterium iodinum ATCC 49514 TaxID=1255616 RepID=A0A2H1JT77_9MICO|nr:hypothetical protein [Brevibacterium iodinum]SMX90700.1 hypothetical protein BI49514_02330 [Brevibacterium iodinum ATCC 49514]SUW12427.1 Uncharacterised protein [Brevibacterium iodinum]